MMDITQNPRGQQVITLTREITIERIREQIYQVLLLGNYGHALLTRVGDMVKIEFKLEGAPECEKRTFWR